MKILNQTKYSILEIEKKWLLDAQNLPNLNTLDFCKIEDKYLNNTRIRLRKVNYNNSEKISYKLCKKYGKLNDFSEPITNIYLTKQEFEIFDLQAGNKLCKTRYYYPYFSNTFAIDEIKIDNKTLYLLELEVKKISDFENLKLPNFIIEEVTLNEKYNGNNLALTTNKLT